MQHALDHRNNDSTSLQTINWGCVPYLFQERLCLKESEYRLKVALILVTAFIDWHCFEWVESLSIVSEELEQSEVQRVRGLQDNRKQVHKDVILCLDIIAFQQLCAYNVSQEPFRIKEIDALDQRWCVWLRCKFNQGIFALALQFWKLLRRHGKLSNSRQCSTRKLW